MKGMKASVSLSIVVALFFLSACAFTPVMPPRGILYNDQQAPLFGGKEVGAKEGRASSYCVFFLVGWGDSSIEAAAKDGNISQIKHMDYRLYNVLGLYQEYTTIVKGE